MQQEDLFLSDEPSPFLMFGGDGGLNRQRVAQIRDGSYPGVPDVETVVVLADLVHDEFRTFGTSGRQRISDDECRVAVRALRDALRRYEIEFELPFYNFDTFKAYWVKKGMSGGGGYEKRRSCLQEFFHPLQAQLEELQEENRRHAQINNVASPIKNLIFAATEGSPKPHITISDSIDGELYVVDSIDNCLSFDQPIGKQGLSWLRLVQWWRDVANLDGQGDIDVSRSLYRRLWQSLASPPEQRLFSGVAKFYVELNRMDLPAIIPQVYLHYDPLTIRQRKSTNSPIVRERMDFLMLLPHNSRVVIEIDGMHHYAENGKPSRERYSKMMAEDRRLRLRGYEVYRFGASELEVKDGQSGGDVQEMLSGFFTSLFQRHDVLS
jgi:very-short-patch-repair endonuclease